MHRVAWAERSVSPDPSNESEEVVVVMMAVGYVVVVWPKE